MHGIEPLAVNARHCVEREPLGFIEYNDVIVLVYRRQIHFVYKTVGNERGERIAYVETDVAFYAHAVHFNFAAFDELVRVCFGQTGDASR